MNKFLNSVRSFLNDDEGAQVIEYALIIAVVSIALVIGLSGLLTNGGGFTNFIARVQACLTTNACV